MRISDWSSDVCSSDLVSCEASGFCGFALFHATGNYFFYIHMAAFNTEQVLSVHHWNDSLFSFKTTRDPALRFHNGHFVMLGLEVNGKPLMRAYSIASANYEENLEFLSITEIGRESCRE